MLKTETAGLQAVEGGGGQQEVVQAAGQEDLLQEGQNCSFESIQAWWHDLIGFIKVNIGFTRTAFQKQLRDVRRGRFRKKNKSWFPSRIAFLNI